MLTLVFNRLCLIPPAEHSCLRPESISGAVAVQIPPQCAFRSADTPVETHDAGEVAPGRHNDLNAGYVRRHGLDSVRVRRVIAQAVFPWAAHIVPVVRPEERAAGRGKRLVQPLEPRLQPAKFPHREADPFPGEPWPVHDYLPPRAVSKLTAFTCTSSS
jgi:hypothetical protein